MTYILVKVFHISEILTASVMMADIDHLLQNHTASHHRGPQSSHIHSQTNSHRHRYVTTNINKDKDQFTVGLYPQTLDILNGNFLCESYKFTVLLSKSHDYQLLRKQMKTGTAVFTGSRNTLIFAHTISRPLIDYSTSLAD